MNNDDTCTLCHKPATSVIPMQSEILGRKIQLMAALCRGCEKLKDRDEILRAYIELIFGIDKIENTRLRT